MDTFVLYMYSIIPIIPACTTTNTGSTLLCLGYSVSIAEDGQRDSPLLNNYETVTLPSYITNYTG